MINTKGATVPNEKVLLCEPFREGFNAALRGLPMDYEAFMGQGVKVASLNGRLVKLRADAMYEKGRLLALELIAAGGRPFPLTKRPSRSYLNYLGYAYHDMNSRYFDRRPVHAAA